VADPEISKSRALLKGERAPPEIAKKKKKINK
jgi:hypothetical protein